LIVTTTNVPAQALQICLHGVDEAATQRTRRLDALTFTRQINTQQSRSFRATGSYVPISLLGLSRTAPEGFEARLSTDGKTYIFSVIDQADACKFGYFSSDSGVIYKAEPLQ
jgi:hypothetical protein